MYYYKIIVIIKNVFLLYFYSYFSFPFQIICFCYMPMNNQTTTVFIEWDEFPKGGSPEFYFLNYQLVNNFAEKVRHLFLDSDKKSA